MRKESRPQKTNISVMKRAFSIVVAMTVLVSCIAFSVNAINYNAPVKLPNSTNQYSDIANNSVKLNSTDNNHPQIWFAANQGYDVYLATLNSGSYLLASQNPDANAWVSLINASNEIESTVSQNLTSYNSATGLYYVISFNTITVSNNNITPSYANSTEALAGIKEFIDNGESDETDTYTLNYSLPAGNIAYVEFSNEFDSFTLKTTMPTTSYIVGSSLWDTTQTYGFASALPSGSLTIPSTTIPWQRDGALSITGVTNKAIFEYGAHHPTSGNYLVISNPAYYGGTANGPYEFLNNGSIQIQAENVVDLKVYQLNSNLAPIPGSNDRLDVTTEGTGVVYEPIFDPETGELVWPDNQEPVVGGGNLTVSSEDGFKSFLSNLVERIKGIFEPAHDAIQTLATAVSNFATTLRSLYMWLPSPVLNILTSAIMLAITIGVIKVFL